MIWYLTTFYNDGTKNTKLFEIYDDLIITIEHYDWYQVRKIEITTGISSHDFKLPEYKYDPAFETLYAGKGNL